MKKIAVFCLICLVMLLSNACSNENSYAGAFGEYEFLDARIADAVDESSHCLAILELQYVNTADETHEPVDSMEKDLIIVNRADSMEVDAILFNGAISEINDAVKYGLSEEDLELINNGYISVEPGGSKHIAVTALFQKEDVDELYLRDRDPNYLNGTLYNRKLEFDEVH